MAVTCRCQWTGVVHVQMYPHIFNEILGTVHDGNIQTNLRKSYRFWYLCSRHVPCDSEYCNLIYFTWRLKQCGANNVFKFQCVFKQQSPRAFSTSVSVLKLECTLKTFSH